MQDPLEQYVVKLLKDKGVPDTPEARNDLLDRVNAATNQALIAALPLAQLEKLEEATKSGQVEDSLIDQLLSEAGADPAMILKEALDQFRNEYLKGDK